MDRWIKFKDGQYPRKGELIMVKSSTGIYPRLLVVEDSLKWWVYLEEDAERYKNGDFSGTQLSFHGLTHWTLLHSDY